MEHLKEVQTSTIQSIIFVRYSLVTSWLSSGLTAGAHLLLHSRSSFCCNVVWISLRDLDTSFCLVSYKCNLKLLSLSARASGDLLSKGVAFCRGEPRQLPLMADLPLLEQETTPFLALLDAVALVLSFVN